MNTKLPDKLKCPGCDIELELDEEERYRGEFECPECNFKFDETFKPMDDNLVANYCFKCRKMAFKQDASEKGVFESDSWRNKIICSVTGRKPYFKEKCIDFKINQINKILDPEVNKTNICYKCNNHTNTDQFKFYVGAKTGENFTIYGTYTETIKSYRVSKEPVHIELCDKCSNNIIARRVLFGSPFILLIIIIWVLGDIPIHFMSILLTAIAALTILYFVSFGTFFRYTKDEVAKRMVKGKFGTNKSFRVFTPMDYYTLRTNDGNEGN
jgi:hypothetical protein